MSPLPLTRSNTAREHACDLTFTANAAWYKELLRRPQMLGTRDIVEVFGVGRTKACSIMRGLGAIKVGRCYRIDRNALVAHIVEHRRLP